MGKQEQKEAIEKYFLGYKPLVNIFHSMIDITFVDDCDNYEAFKAKIIANRVAGDDQYIKARMMDTKFIYEYFPVGDGTGIINWTASQQYETI